MPQTTPARITPDEETQRLLSDAAHRLTCTYCGETWERPVLTGRRPRYCSRRCARRAQKQAAKHRSRLSRAKYSSDANAQTALDAAIRHALRRDAQLTSEERAALMSSRELNRWVITLAKTGPCMDCGQTFHPVVMDLDHRPGVEKCFELSVSLYKPTRLIHAEIEKCDRVCANCHRMRTATRAGWI